MRNRTAKYDLAVAYRIYPGIAEGAQGLPFSGDKYQLAQACLRSFRKSLGGLRARIWVLLDGCPPAYAELFRKYFAEEDLVLVPMPGVGNHATLLKQIEILAEQEDAELVYFAEDDYYYLPNAFQLMTGLMQAYNDVHFISAYDHLDCYTLDLHRKPKWLRVFGDHHWRTAVSTCHTFLTKREILRQTAKVFANYGMRNCDCSQWMCLTKLNLMRPLDCCRWFFNEPFFARLVVKSWLFGWQQILFGKKYRLWVPVPGMATHMNAGTLSPSIDWVARMREDDLAPRDESTAQS